MDKTLHAARGQSWRQAGIDLLGLALLLAFTVADHAPIIRKKIGTIALAAIALHILLSLLSVILPLKAVRSNPITSIYKNLIVLGPYFQASRITSSGQLFISHQVAGTWSVPRNYAQEHFNHYCAHPWRYDRLHAGDYEKYLAWGVAVNAHGAEQEFKKTRVFRELNQFAMGELIRQPVDSLSIIYVRRFYLPESNSYREDTLFKYSYDPQIIHSAKATN